MFTALLGALCSGIVALGLGGPDGPANPDFELGEVGSPEAKWFMPTMLAESYEVTFVTDNPKQGKRCALIRSLREPKAGLFGNVMQSFAAEPLLGQRVRLTAAVRTDLPTTSRAQLWMRVDRAGNKMGFFDNMGDRPIRSESWGEFTITGEIDADAETINVGCMLLGTGRVWLDHVRFEVLGRVGEGDQPARPLDDRGLVNVVAFSRLFGYVRHFHPSDEAAKIDAPDFAIRGVRVVEGAKSADELARTLEELFRPIAPTVRVYPNGDKPELPAELLPPKGEGPFKLTAWRHQGFGSGTPPIYSSRRVTKELFGSDLPSGFESPGEPFSAELGGGVSCLVPLSLYADGDGTLPHNSGTPKLPEHPSGFSPSGKDRATRLADVIVIWNILQHFYPYFDVVQTDWSAALETALKSAASDENEAAFRKTLRRMVAALHDGHGHVSGPGDEGYAMLPVLWDWIENSLVVTKLAPGYAGEIKRGDVIVSVDGVAAERALAAEEKYISGATPQWRRLRALNALAMGNSDTRLTLEIKPRSGAAFTEMLERTMLEEPLTEDRPEPIAEVKPGVYYVDLSRTTDKDFEAALSKLEAATGIVFDLRGYPNRVSPGAIIGHFIDEWITSPQWHVPKVARPDRQNMEFKFSNWPVVPAAPRLKARCAYITGGGAISYAETWLGMIENYKLAAIVGSPTAGTNGNVNPIRLPGGYSVTWTGMKVLKHDGSQHHGVGIRPTVPVSRTIAGVAAGRDGLLETAIREVSR